MQDDLSADPGAGPCSCVRPDKARLGLGQVQSNVGGGSRVNFENEGKLVLDARHVPARLVFLD